MYKKITEAKLTKTNTLFEKYEYIYIYIYVLYISYEQENIG